MSHVHAHRVSNRLEIEANKTDGVPAFTDPKIYETNLIQARKGQRKGRLEQKEQHRQRHAGVKQFGITGSRTARQWGRRDRKPLLLYSLQRSSNS